MTSMDENTNDIQIIYKIFTQIEHAGSTNTENTTHNGSLPTEHGSQMSSTTGHSPQDNSSLRRR
jgi:hypothetical protein